MEYNKQVTMSTAQTAFSNKGKKFALLAVFGGLSFYGIGALGMMTYDILMKLFG